LQVRELGLFQWRKLVQGKYKLLQALDSEENKGRRSSLMPEENFNKMTAISHTQNLSFFTIFRPSDSAAFNGYHIINA